MVRAVHPLFLSFLWLCLMLGGCGSPAGTITEETDEDLDGYSVQENDCNDADKKIHPGQVEQCNGVDDDCNGFVDEGLPFYNFAADEDRDGFGDPEMALSACEQPPNMVPDDTDCDDNDPRTFPGGVEVCDGKDNNCNGLINEGLDIRVFYRDRDGDGYGDTLLTDEDCGGVTSGYAVLSGDCDDGDELRHPGRAETCDDVDNDCDGVKDDGLQFFIYYPDRDRDGVGGQGTTRTECRDPGEGYSKEKGDCVDSSSAIFPGAQEVCDGFDNDCDGAVDDGIEYRPYHPDLDGDGFGDLVTTIMDCALVEGMVQDGSDCDDTEPGIHPGAEEVCDGVDENCDGLADDGLPFTAWYQDLDEDGQGSFDIQAWACAEVPGLTSEGGDCDDENADVYAGAPEIPGDGIDQGCDGYVDELVGAVGRGKGLWGDGGPATLASLYYPQGVGVDADGNLYVADSRNHVIRKVGMDGLVVRLAGTGEPGFAGDGGLATQARLHSPAVVYPVAGEGVYVSDYLNQRIRLITEDGTIHTVIGTGQAGFLGDEGPASEAWVDGPLGMIKDAGGTLYFADSGNRRVRRVSPDGVITTYAGNGQKGYTGELGQATAAALGTPTGLAIDKNGLLYIADAEINRILRVRADGGIVTVVGNNNTGYGGDGMVATAASLTNPRALVFDAQGNMLFTDAGAQRIRKVSAFTNAISTVAGTGRAAYEGDGSLATRASLYNPGFLAMDKGGNLFLADEYNQRIRRIDASGLMSSVIGGGSPKHAGDNGYALSADLGFPLGVATDDIGNVYIADTNNHRVRKVDTKGLIVTLAGNGSSGYGGDGGVATVASMSSPSGLVVDDRGNVYVSDSGNVRIRKIERTGIIVTVAGSGAEGLTGDGGPALAAAFMYPRGLALGEDGSLYIADSEANVIRVVDPEGIMGTVAGDGVAGFDGDGGQAVNASLREPWDVFALPDGTLYIADTGNDRIRRVLPSGIITSVAGSGGYEWNPGPALATTVALDGPRGVVMDSQLNLFFTDSMFNCVRKVSVQGQLITVAGDGSDSTDGLYGPAIDAGLFFPTDLALGVEDELLIAITYGHRIGKVQW